MIEIDLDKTLENEATGYIKIEKLIKIEAGAVYNDGGNVTVNVYGKEQAKKSPEGLQQEATKSEVAALEKEDEELLLPIFKGSRENLRQFFAEVQGAEPEQVTNKLNAWIVDGKIAKKFNIKNLWEILYKMKIYPYTYEAMNKHVMR